MNRTTLALLLGMIAGTAQAKTAKEILKNADEIRNPSTSYNMQVSVESNSSPEFRFEIHIGGKDKSIIKTLEPQREIGKNYLMLGENMWAYIPNIRRSVRVSLNQKLTGQASNGDISRMRWYGDYDAKIESETAKQWVLLLNAQKRGLTYEKIRVWINKSNFRPTKGEYLSADGKPLKFITFNKYAQMGGSIRPTEMKITNAMKVNDYSILKILTMSKQNISDSYFSKSNIK